jgi:hypothetical protein
VRQGKVDPNDAGDTRANPCHFFSCTCFDYPAININVACSIVATEVARSIVATEVAHSIIAIDAAHSMEATVWRAQW